MLPKIILFNHIVINFYGFFVSLGVLGGLLLFYKTAPLRGINAKKLINFGIIMALFGVLGSRVLFIILNWNFFRGGSWFDLVAFWRGGLTFQGGPILAVAVAPIFLAKFQLKFWATADAIAPSLALGQGIGRVGCFFAGCCYGLKTSAANPIAVVFPLHSQAPALAPLWPTQLMESISLLSLSYVLTYLLKTSYARYRPGVIAGLYLFGAGLIRFVVDFFRGDNRGHPLLGMPPTTIISLLICLTGLTLLIFLAQSTPESPQDVGARPLS
jgi:phosphatidylglycerol:prolipoprotein diacylglycerol transferase